MNPASQKILMVTADQTMTDQLAPFLERAGYQVAVATSGAQALGQVARFGPQLIVLDVIMPRMSGREVLRQLRAGGNWTPVILVSQVGDAVERAMALEEGADDYLNKPVEAQELVARIRAVLRRTIPPQPPLSAAQRLASLDMVLERAARRVLRSGRELSLTPKAVALLDYLMTHPGELITRERLLEVIWGWADPVGARTVDTRIAELRKALNDTPDQHRFIETVPGEGYRFVAPVEVLS